MLTEMNIFPILYLFCLVFTSIKSAPTNTKVTLYDVVVKKCPSVKNLPKFEEEPVFKTCSNWEKINKVQKLEDSSKTDVLCLLYYYSFTEYCSNTEEVNTNMSIVYNIEINKICDNLDIIPKQTELDSALHKIIATKDHCNELCNDGFGNSIPICSVSYHYSHLLDKIDGKTNKNHMLKVLEPIDKTQQLKEGKVQDEVNPKPAHQTDNNNQPPKTAVQDKKDKVEPKVTSVPQTPDIKDQISAETPQNLPDKSLVDGIIGKTLGDNNNDANDATNNSPQKPPPLEVNTSKIKENIEVSSEKKDPGAHELEKTENQKKLTDVPTVQKDEDTIPNPSQNVQSEVQPENNDQDKNADGSEFNHVPDVPENIESEEDPEQPQEQLNEKPPKPIQIDETEAVNFTTEMDGDSYFFTYFMLLCVIFIVGYVCYHNKQKLLALILEGRRGKRQYRGRRPNSNNYHKLDSNLEEAITSSCNKNTNNVIY